MTRSSSGVRHTWRVIDVHARLKPVALFGMLKTDEVEIGDRPTEFLTAFRPFCYLMSTRPPGPIGEPFFGNGRRYAEDPFEFMRECADAYGDIVRFELGPQETYMLTNPADIQRVLVGDAEKYRKADFGDSAIDRLLGDGLLMSDGATWRKQRDLATPSFHPKRLAGLTEMMADHAAETVDSWEPGEQVDVQLEMARLTVRIIVNAMFGTDVDDERVESVQENLEPLGARFEPNPKRFIIPDWAPTEANREFDAALAELEAVIDDMLADRRGTQHNPAVDPASDAIAGGIPGAAGSGADAEVPMDLLSVLLRAHDRGEQTDANLRDELVTILLAGHDTTALTLTYTWYLLSNHPDAATRLQQEVDEVVGDGRPSLTDIQRLDFTEQVLNEAMRLYPPVYTLFRETNVGVKHGGYRIPADATLMLPQWVVHRSPRWWDEPDTFDPDRWESQRQTDRPRFASFPFGGGPRMCIGKRFSLMEAKLIIATVAQQYDLEYVGPQMELRGSLTMHPQHPVPVEIAER